MASNYPYSSKTYYFEEGYMSNPSYWTGDWAVGDTGGNQAESTPPPYASVPTSPKERPVVLPPMIRDRLISGETPNLLSLPTSLCTGWKKGDFVFLCEPMIFIDDELCYASDKSIVPEHDILRGESAWVGAGVMNRKSARYWFRTESAEDCELSSMSETQFREQGFADRQEFVKFFMDLRELNLRSYSRIKTFELVPCEKPEVSTC